MTIDTYSLYECDAVGTFCRGKHIAYVGAQPFKLVVDDIAHKMTVKLPSRNSSQEWVLYEVYAPEPC